MRILKALSMAIVMSGALLWGGKTVHAAEDVSKDAWYYDAVKYVMDQKYMNGTSAKDFEPLSGLTRAQFVQVLYNIEGCPGVIDNSLIGSIEDAKDRDSWYYEAVIWAIEDDIAKGIAPNFFGADSKITREQIATILYKYAIRSGEYKIEIEESALDAFPDKNKISSWAKEPLKWAVGNGIMSGKIGDKGNILDPEGYATRAECAQMIMNFREKVRVEIPALPEKFDLRDVVEIPVEDQGRFGLCWDFAAMKCLETNLALTKGLICNFSEIHVGYIMSYLISPYLSEKENGLSRDFDDGGTFGAWLQYNLVMHGFLPDEDLDYKGYQEKDYQNFTEMELVPINVVKTKEFPKHTYSTWQMFKSEVTVENIKRQVKDHIMKYGAVWVSVDISQVEGGEDTYLYSEYYGSSHAMAIIGWDDHIPKEKFAREVGENDEKHMIQPKKDGGYIVLNSWGINSGDHGVMYISYEDCNVHNSLRGIISANDEDLIDLHEEKGLNIREAIQKKYPEWVFNKDGKQYVNPAQTELCDKIDLSGCGITTLEGIEELAIFENCATIDLSDNEIVDLTPLKSAKLNKLCDLRLNHNKITDITALSSLKNIAYLELDNNQLTDISELAIMKKLSYLSVKDNQLKDVTCLENCGGLTALYLDGNKSVTGYGELNWLKELGLSDCGLSKVEKLSDLYKLDLSRNPIGDQIDSVRLDGITELILQECGLKRVPSMGKVDTLDLSGNPDIKDFSALKTKDIYNLKLCNCGIVDGSIFPIDWHVYKLDLSGNVGIHNLGGLADNVEFTVLRKCAITDVAVLGDKVWNRVDLSENIGLYGRLNVCGLFLENCGLDDQFDFFGEDTFEELCIKGNSISLESVLDRCFCSYISCDPISLEEFHMITSGKYGDVEIEADVYTTLNLPASAKERTIKLLPIIRHYFPPFETRDNYFIKEGMDIEYDPYLLTGKMQGDHARVIVESRYMWEAEKDSVSFFNICNFNFILDIQIVDQLQEEYLKVYMDELMDYQVGDKVDLSSVEVERFFESGYSEFISDYEIIGPEILEFGENKFIVKHGDIEGQFVIDAAAEIYFETMEVFSLLVDEIFNFGGMNDFDYETKLIKINKRGKAKLDNYFWSHIPSSMIWDLAKLKGIVSLQNICIQYDGHKIDEKDLEVLKDLCYFGPLTPSPCLTIYSIRGEDKEDIIVEQDIFTVEYVVENPDILSSEEIVSNDETDPELPDAYVAPENIDAVEDIFDVAEMNIEDDKPVESNTEEINPEEYNLEEINSEELNPEEIITENPNPEEKY